MATSDAFIQDNYAPVTEEVTATELRVTGTIPEGLDGRFLRIGPNPVDGPDPDAHWFTGSGMAHGLRLRDGKADWYRNRYVVSDGVSETLGRPITPGPRSEISDGTANTNIIEHAGQTLAIVEAGGQPVVLTDELETIERTDFAGTLDGSFTAHPKRHPLTGELHAVVYYFGWEFLRYMVIGVDGLVRRRVDVSMTTSPMVHDCAITASSVLLFDFPCHFDLDAAMSGQPLPYRWNPDAPARVGVLPLDGDAESVRWCDVDPCYVFHPVNAFDTVNSDGNPDGTIQVDVVRHPSMFNNVTNGPLEGTPTLDRWIIDPANGTVKEERLDDRSQEFPRHDERLIGSDARFGYTVGWVGNEGPAFKHDLRQGTSEVHDFGPGRATQEMVFVPRTPDSAEDDGWCMSYVHDANTDSADVVILSAQDFEGDPVATVHLPQRVPFGFHGNWIPTS